jgi:hypothetical protein
MPLTGEVDLSQLPGSEELPADLRKVFTDVRLPSLFMEWDDGRADFALGPDLRQIDVPSAGRLVRFGRHIGRHGPEDFCVDPATGEVILVLVENGPWFVNSSLDLMARTIRLASGFERQFTTGDAEEVWIAAGDFRDAMEQVDPRD